MTTRRLLARWATAAAVALVAFPAPAFARPAGTDTTPPTTAAGSSTTVVDDAAGDLPVVNSWALGPADQSGTESTGKRSLLSYVADPGTVIHDAVTLYNLSNVPMRFRVYATDGINGLGGNFDLLAGNLAPSDVGSWVRLEQEMVDVQPRQQVTMPVTIVIPADATPGDHSGAILASSAAQSTNADGAVVTVDRRTGARLNLRVNGPLRSELAVEGLSTSYHPSVNPFDGRVTITYRIHNRGNVRLGGSHQESVAGPFGAGRRRLPAAEFPEILPGQSVTIETEIDKVPALFRATTTVEVEPTKSGDGLLATAATRTSGSFSPPILLLVLVALLLVFVVRRRIRRHRGVTPTNRADAEYDDDEYDDEYDEHEVSAR